MNKFVKTIIVVLAVVLPWTSPGTCILIVPPMGP